MDLNRDTQRELVKAFEEILGVNPDLFFWSELDIHSERKAMRLEFVLRFDQSNDDLINFWRRVNTIINKFDDYHSNDNAIPITWKNV